MPALSAPTPPAILPTNGDNNEQPEAVQAAASAQPAPAAGKRQAVQVSRNGMVVSPIGKNSGVLIGGEPHQNF
jgi:hypothetical protein